MDQKGLQVRQDWCEYILGLTPEVLRRRVISAKYVEAPACATEWPGRGVRASRLSGAELCRP
jgi:hypothetical protein